MSDATWLPVSPVELNALTVRGAVAGSPTWAELVSPLAGSMLEWLTPGNGDVLLRDRLDGVSDEARPWLAAAYQSMASIIGSPDRVLSFEFLAEPDADHAVAVVAGARSGVVTLVFAEDLILARVGDSDHARTEFRLLEDLIEAATQMRIIASGWNGLTSSMRFEDGVLMGHSDSAGLEVLAEFANAPLALGWIADLACGELCGQ